MYFSSDNAPYDQLPHLAVDGYLAGYPQIRDNFEQRLPLLPKMLEIQQASSQEIVQIQEWLLESLK